MSTSLMLTEISLQLLGNSFFDILGNSQESVSDLFKAIQYDEYSKRDNTASNDLCEELGLTNLLTFTSYEKMIDEKFEQLLDVVVVPGGDNRQSGLSEVELGIQVNHMKEFVKIVQQSESSFPEELTKIQSGTSQDLVQAYYESERMKLINECLNLLRLMSYIIDQENFKQNPNRFTVIESLDKLKYLLHEDK